MTPKEKAIELMQKYRALGLNELTKKSEYGVLVGITSKQCALIAVDEMINMLERYSDYKSEYWRAVKNEIELL